MGEGYKPDDLEKMPDQEFETSFNALTKSFMGKNRKFAHLTINAKRDELIEKFHVYSEQVLNIDMFTLMTTEHNLVVPLLDIDSDEWPVPPYELDHFDSRKEAVEYFRNIEEAVNFYNIHLTILETEFIKFKQSQN